MIIVECEGEIGMFFFGKKKEEDKNYRKVGLETNYSNYGWYTCVHCGRKFRKGDIDIDHILPQSRVVPMIPEIYSVYASIVTAQSKRTQVVQERI